MECPTANKVDVDYLLQEENNFFVAVTSAAPRLPLHSLNTAWYSTKVLGLTDITERYDTSLS